MNAGRWVIVAVLAVAALGGAGLFYLQAFHYYQRVTGLVAIDVGGQAFAVEAYDGLDNDSLPLRLRGCFRLVEPDAALAAGRVAADAEPFAAPFWFDCWDAEGLADDLAAGRARAVVAETAGEGEFATERIVAVYPDGRAYQWRRLRGK